MEALTNTFVFGVLLTIGAFALAVKIRQISNSVFFNPFIISIVLIIIILKVFNVPYENFKRGADSISVFLGPVTVLLAVPLYKHRNLLKNFQWAIFLGILAGALTSLIEIHFLSKLFGLDIVLKNSLMAKSVTAPIAIEITNNIGGIEGLVVFGVILSGILGSFIAPFLYKLMGIKHPIAQGVALGTASHAIGTSKALELGELQGAVAGLSIGIAGIITVAAVAALKLFGLL